LYKKGKIWALFLRKFANTSKAKLEKYLLFDKKTLTCNQKNDNLPVHSIFRHTKINHPMSATVTTKRIISSCPLFMVQDLQRSLDFYCDKLGFRRPELWGDPPGFAMPDRDGFIIMLSQTEDQTKIQPNGRYKDTWDAYFWVEDAQHLYEEWQAKGIDFGYKPVRKELYGMLEFTLHDPDGYLLAFASDLES